VTNPVVALAGRRIDAVDDKHSTFPLGAVPRVSADIEAYLRRVAPVALFSAAACGADIIALRVAKALGIPRTVILPYDRDLFRSTSVRDRPGHWEDYDQIIDEVADEGGLKVLDFKEASPAAFQAVNTAILDGSQSFGYPVQACIVWEGADQGKGGYTSEFRDSARDRSINVNEILIFRPKP
jgi:hypothetical protein